MSCTSITKIKGLDLTNSLHHGYMHSLYDWCIYYSAHMIIFWSPDVVHFTEKLTSYLHRWSLPLLQSSCTPDWATDTSHYSSGELSLCWFSLFMMFTLWFKNKIFYMNKIWWKLQFSKPPIKTKPFHSFQAASAFNYMHSKNIVHRDIKVKLIYTKCHENVVRERYLSKSNCVKFLCGKRENRVPNSGELSWDCFIWTA